MPKQIFTISDGVEEIDFEWDGDGEPGQDVLNSVMAQARQTRQQPPAPKAPPPQTVSPDETSNPLLAGAKGFLQGAKESWPVQTFTPDFILEGRMPNKQDAQRILPGVAGVAAGVGTALTGVGLPVAIPTAMAAAGGTSAALGNSAGTVVRDTLLEAIPGGAAAGAKLVSRGGRAMMRNALGLKGTAKEVAPVIETALREGIDAGRGGLNKTVGRISGLNQEVQRALHAIKDQKVSLERGVANMRQLRDEMTRQRVPQGEIDSLTSLIDDLGARGGEVPVLDAQGIKSAGQARHAKTYASDAPSAAKKEGEVRYLSGVREGIEEAAKANGLEDAVGPVNQRVGQLHELETVLRKSTDREAVTGGDVASTMAFGPKYSIARVGLRGKPESLIGRRLAMEGDAAQRLMGLGPVNRAEAARADRLANEAGEAQSVEFARRRGNAQQQRLDAADTALGVERPGEASFDVGAQGYPLDRVGVPETGLPVDTEALWEQSVAGQRSTYTDRLTNRPIRTADDLGIPAQGTPVDPSLNALPVERPGGVGQMSDEEAWIRHVTRSEMRNMEVPPRYFPSEDGQAFARQDRFRGDTPGAARLEEVQNTFEVSKPRAAAIADEQGRFEDMSVELLDPENAVGPQANYSGVTDASTEALSAAKDGWEYAAAKGGTPPRPLIGLRPEDNSLNPGEILVRRRRGETRWSPY